MSKHYNLDFEKAQHLCGTANGIRSDSVLVCIDLERKDRGYDLHAITEVGVSILDLREIRCTPIQSVTYAQHMANRITSHHFRVGCYRKHINKYGHRGCPADFAFGYSQMVSKWYLVDEVRRCMFPDQTRHYVVIAHAKGMEESWLNANLIHSGEILDTQAIDRHLRNKELFGSLSDVCQKLGIETEYLHNGGNDARYELECFLRLACLANEDLAEYKIGYVKGNARPLGWVNTPEAPVFCSTLPNNLPFSETPVSINFRTADRLANEAESVNTPAISTVWSPVPMPSRLPISSFRHIKLGSFRRGWFPRSNSQQR